MPLTPNLTLGAAARAGISALTGRVDPAAPTTNFSALQN
jgi:hypothetical protein